MKKLKVTLVAFIFVSIALSLTPAVVPQVGIYTFHGAPGDSKILKVDIVNNASLADLFGANWDDILEEFFGVGCVNIGARKKSVVTAVNFTAKDYYFGFPATNYTTDNWKWTTGDFPGAPDDLTDFTVTSLYNPLNITWIVSFVWGMGVTIQNAAAFFAQLPTSVAQYLGAIVWEPKWQNVGNTVVHTADAMDLLINYANLNVYTYYEDCTEIWTYDGTFGAWIGYEIRDNETNTIYKFSIDLPTAAEIPGFELTIVLGTAVMTSIGLIYVLIKKKKLN
ncbi:MAG: hypothetical protein ACFFAK_10525 [Promethearchaeota archaeon]